MKKVLFSVFISIFLVYASSANTLPDIEKTSKDANCKNSEQENQKCDLCNENDLDDDEYCFYNQCFFDKQYREMKRILCLTKNQETKIDNIYRNFKVDMENFHCKYRTEKNKLLEMISCCEHKGAIKKQKEKLKEIKRFTKIKIKDYKEDLIEELCKSQRKDLRKFLKKERNKIKQIAKYASVFKFPCGNCCEQNKVK